MITDLFTIIMYMVLAFVALIALSALGGFILEIRDRLHDPARELTEKQLYFIGDKVISLSPRKGYGKYQMTVMCDPYEHIGRFNGCAVCDDEQIKIYNDRGEYIGISENDYSLRQYIEQEGNKVHAYGLVALTKERHKYGWVCVENDKSMVKIRNKPYPYT